jgi:light-regulated signal transduction histidine kinase (bacteriophytochrome)
MKKKYLFIAILIISTLLTGCGKERKADILENNSKKINKLCPVRVDSLLILDSTFYNREKNSMTYFYTASGILDDSLLLHKNYNQIKSSLIDAMDNSVDMKKFKDYEVTIIYKYSSDTTGNELATFTLPTKKE